MIERVTHFEVENRFIGDIMEGAPADGLRVRVL